MKRRNPLPRRLLEREPTFSQQMMAIARSVSKDEPGGLELRATLTAQALKLRKLELANPSPATGKGPLSCPPCATTTASKSPRRASSTASRS